MSLQYSVERVSPSEVESTLAALWSRNLHLDGAPGAKFGWLYRRAPHPAPDVFVLKHDGRSVGTAGVFVRRVRVAGELVEAALLGDFAVDAGHRTLLPALTLMRAVRRHVRARYGLVYGFPNPLAEGVCRRVGYSELTTMVRYVRVLRHDRFVRRLFDVPLLTSGAAHAVDAMRLVVSLPPAIRAVAERRLEWSTRADARIDQLWSEAAHEYTIVGERSAAFVQWRLLDHPTEPCQLAALTTRDGARVLAYAALYFAADSMVHVRDLFGHRDEVGRLLDMLLPTLWRRGAASLSVRTSGDVGLVADVMARGFTAREKTRRVIAEPGESLPPSAHEAVGTRLAWYLTDADEDI